MHKRLTQIRRITNMHKHLTQIRLITNMHKHLTQIRLITNMHKHLTQIRLITNIHKHSRTVRAYMGRTDADRQLENTCDITFFGGHRQIVQTKIRCRSLTRCLIRVSTVCLHDFLLKFE